MQYRQAWQDRFDRVRGGLRRLDRRNQLVGKDRARLTVSSSSRRPWVSAFTLFDTADTYSEGFGEEILAKAIGSNRHDVVYATKFGYDIYNAVPREGHRERPQDFSPDFIRFACEQSLRRLNTDYIDLYQTAQPPHHRNRTRRGLQHAGGTAK